MKMKIEIKENEENKDFVKKFGKYIIDYFMTIETMTNEDYIKKIEPMTNEDYIKSMSNENFDKNCKISTKLNSIFNEVSKIDENDENILYEFLEGFDYVDISLIIE